MKVTTQIVLAAVALASVLFVLTPTPSHGMALAHFASNSSNTTNATTTTTSTTSTSTTTTLKTTTTTTTAKATTTTTMQTTTTTTTATETHAPSPAPASYNHKLSVSNETGICLLLDFDKVFAAFGDQVVNATGARDQNVTGVCYDWTSVPGSSNFSLSANVQTTYVVDDVSITLAFTFLQNATYTSKDESSLVYGDQSSALAGIEMTFKDKDGDKQAFFTNFGDYDLAMDSGVSYKCKYNFTYNSNHTVPEALKANLTIYNIRAQPFVPIHQNDFSKTNDNSYCPRDDTEVKRIGLIVGGILTGLALLGIVIFSVTACRGRGGYETLKD